MEVRMDDAPFFLHMDTDYLWRWYVIDATGKSVAVSRPFFHLVEAQNAMRVFALPLAA
jgi:hypothetical protein